MGQLTLLLLLPVLGVPLIALLPGDRPHWVRAVALGSSSLALILSWSLLAGFNSTIPGIQYTEFVSWNPRLGASFALGLDGFSYPMVLLTTLLSLVALLASASIRERVKAYYMLVLETAMLGVFMAQDWSLFYVFWEGTLIPVSVHPPS